LGKSNEPIHVDISDRQQDLPLDLAKTEAIVSEVIKLENQSAHEVGIHFVSKDEICLLHKQYFDDPTPTDCISLPIEDLADEYRMLGDLFVCPATAIEYGEKHKVDPYEECTLYLVHSLLHLLGYDDIEENDRSKMEKQQNHHMKNLKDKKLLLNPTNQG
jgi:probable rRNA maturation factor